MPATNGGTKKMKVISESRTVLQYEEYEGLAAQLVLLHDLLDGLNHPGVAVTLIHGSPSAELAKDLFQAATDATHERLVELGGQRQDIGKRVEYLEAAITEAQARPHAAAQILGSALAGTWTRP